MKISSRCSWYVDKDMNISCKKMAIYWNKTGNEMDGFCMNHWGVMVGRIDLENKLIENCLEDFQYFLNRKQFILRRKVSVKILRGKRG